MTDWRDWRIKHHEDMDTGGADPGDPYYLPDGDRDDRYVGLDHRCQLADRYQRVGTGRTPVFVDIGSDRTPGSRSKGGKRWGIAHSYHIQGSARATRPAESTIRGSLHIVWSDS